MIVRAEELADTAAIHAVHAACFPSDAEARLVDGLRDDGDLTVSLVALIDAQVIGHVAFSPVTTGNHRGLGLAPVAVLPAHRRRGVADALIRRGLERCRQLESGFVVVLGDPAYYGRFGFEAAHLHGLVDEYAGGDAFQALEVTAEGMPDAGVVRYARAFAAL